MRYNKTLISALAATTMWTAYAQAKPTYSYDSSTKTLTIGGSGEVNAGTVGAVLTFRDTTIEYVQHIVFDPHSNITSIGDGAFNGSIIESIDIPNTVTSIGSSAFGNCSNLTSITIPNSVTSIGYGAFAGTALESVTIPDSVTSIGDYAFQNTRLKDVTIPQSVISLGRGAFFGTSSLQNLTIEGEYVSFGGIGDLGSNYGLSDSAAFLFGKAPNFENLYCSAEMQEACQELLNNRSIIHPTDPAGELTVFEKDGNYYKVGNKKYTSTENMMNNNAVEVKRIYTIEEAQAKVKEIGKDHVRFRIRYK